MTKIKKLGFTRCTVSSSLVGSSRRMIICLVWSRGNYFEIIERNINAANIGLAIQPFQTADCSAALLKRSKKIEEGRENLRPNFYRFGAKRDFKDQTPEKNSFFLGILLR